MSSASAHAPRRAVLIQLALVGLVLIVLTAVGPALNKTYGGMAHWVIMGLTAAGAAWATFAGERADARWALLIIAIVGVAMRVLQLGIEPYLSDDIYRYIWDGRVQAAGINPYRYIPAAPELTPLRDAEIYPYINRANYAPTIYPPVAQMFYLGVTRLGESVLVMKVALVVCETIALAATLFLLFKLELPATRIAAFAWHPLAVWEIAGSGHIDALMLALMMLALAIALRGRTLVAGVVATAAALVKPTALLVLPVLWRPWRIVLPLIVIASVAVFYAPYLSVGTKVLGFLPGYVAEEGLAQGHGFRLVMIAEKVVGTIPNGGTIYAGLFALVMLALAFHASFRQDRSPAGTTAALTVLLTAFLVLLTPHYPWYYLALVPFVAVYPWSLTLWVLTVAGVETYNEIPNDWLPDYGLRQIVFNALVLIALMHDGWRLRGRRQTQMTGAVVS